MLGSSSARILTVFLAGSAGVVACGFDGTGSAASTTSSTEPGSTSGASGGPSAVGPNDDGGAMSTAICQDGVLGFDGVDDFGTVDNADVFNLGGDFTVEAWIKPNEVMRQMDLVAHDDPGPATGWVLRINAGRIEAEVYGHVGGIFGINSSETAGASGDAYVVVGKWAFVAATMKGGTLTVWYDGVNKGQASPPFTFSRDSYGGKLTFGRASESTNNAYNGRLDDVRLSNIARYTNTFTKPTTELASDANALAVWHFDEPNGRVLNDETDTHPVAEGTEGTAAARELDICAASR